MKQNKMTGNLAIGNGEKCPFCSIILDDKIKGKEIQNHLFKKHQKELTNKLFPKDKLNGRVCYCRKCNRFTDANYHSDKFGGRKKSYCYKCAGEMLELVKVILIKRQLTLKVTTMKDAISWFKKTVTGENLYSNEGYKDFEVALLMAKKEVFDDIEMFNDSLSKRLYNSSRYKELKQCHLSKSTLEEHDKNCRICKSINEKGKAEKISHLNTDNSNQPTPQIMTAEEITKNVVNYSVTNSQEEFIPLSLVEATLNEILEEIDKVFDNSTLGYYKTYGKITTDKKIKQIITKYLKEIGVDKNS